MDVENLGRGVTVMPRPRTRRSPRPHKEDAELGERLRLLRKGKGLSQEELGNRIGQTQHVISFYEQGRTRLPAKMFLKIAGVLRVSLKEFSGTNGDGDQTLPRRISKMIDKVRELPEKKQRQVTEYVDLLASRTNGQRAA